MIFAFMTQIASIMNEFRDYLLNERCLCETSSTLYCHYVFEFLKSLPDMINCTSFTDSNVKSYIEQKSRISSGATIYVILSILLVFSKFLFHEGLRDSYLNIVYRPKYRIPKKSYIPVDSILTLINSPNESTASGLKEKAILHLLYATGMRVSELCNIKYSDINLLDKTIRVQGKGQKERLTIFDSSTEELIKRYIAITPRNSCYLFHNVETGKRITPFQVARIVKIHAMKNKLHITPHIIRHCFASHMYEQGAPLQTIQRFLGHSSPQTTDIYIQVSSHFLIEQYRKAMGNKKRKETTVNDFKKKHTNTKL